MNRKCRPLSKRALADDVTVVTFDDAPADAESQSGAFTAFGREKRLPDALQVFGSDATAGIRYGDSGTSIGFVNQYGEFSGLPLHGLGAVAEQIEQHLHQLVPIEFDIGVRGGLELGAADFHQRVIARKVERLLHNRHQRLHRSFVLLAVRAGKVPNLVDHRHHALLGVEDELNELALALVFRVTHQNFSRRQGRKLVFEFVGNAAGKLSERGQFFLVDEAFLGGAQFFDEVEIAQDKPRLLGQSQEVFQFLVAELGVRQQVIHIAHPHTCLVEAIGAHITE